MYAVFLAIASSALRRDVDLALGKMGLTTLFPPERIITLESITHPKSHPEAFNMAFATFDLPEHERQRVCTFEDDPRGSMAAYAAGLYVCAITTRFSREHLQSLGIPPHAIADTYQEFFELFRLQ